MTDSKIGFFSSAIQNWDYLKRALVLIILIFIFLTLFTAVVLWKLESSGLRVKLDENTTLIFGDGNSLHRYLIHPRGWQDTGLEIAINDKIWIKAEGSINIGMGRIAKATINRYEKAEEFYNKNRERYPKKSDFKYEDFPNDIKEELSKHYPWFGPEGLDPRLVQDPEIKDNVMTWEERQLFKGYGAQFGQLIAMVVPKDELDKFKEITPSPSVIKTKYDWWPISKNPIEHTVAKNGGHLLFIINDVMSEDNLVNKMLWMDNIGFLSALIKIEK